MASFNQVQFIGRLGKDPELQVTGTGKPFTKFSLAVDQGKDAQGKDRGAMWLNVTTWDKLAEITEKYATKGVQVFVQGKLQIRAYEDKQGAKQQAVDIVANVVQILDKKPTGERPPTAADDGTDPWIPSE
jgi:single-strand DNA-binding protein